MKDLEINPADFDILVCDDESSIRSMLGEALSGWGFNVQTAPSGEAAVESIKNGNIPHVVLTDIRMGGMTGIQLAGEVKKISEEIEVVIMTSHGSFDTAIQAMRLGVYDYLSKPFDNINDVETVIRHVCKRIYMRFYTEYLVKEIEDKSKESMLLAETGEALSESLDLGKLLNVATQRISKGFEDSVCVFFQYIQKESCIRLKNRFPVTFADGVELSIPVQASSNEELEKYLLNLPNDAMFLENLKTVSGITSTQECKVQLLKPRGVVQGVFCVLRESESEWTDSKTHLLHRYLQLISTSFENALLHAKVVAASIRDGLTGLFNVRHFKERMMVDFKQFERMKTPASIVFLDVDHFKVFNDTNGHPAGDEVLRIVAKLLRTFFRATDIVARYGGEEFVVAMPNTPFVNALKKAEGFRKLVEETVFPHGEKQPLGKVTVSIGVAEFPVHGSNLDMVLKAADDALYQGKKASRNTVVGATAPAAYVPPF